MSEENGKKGDSSASEASAPTPDAAPKSEGGVESTPAKKSSFTYLKRPEIAGAIIVGVGALLVPVVEYMLPDRENAQALPEDASDAANTDNEITEQTNGNARADIQQSVPSRDIVEEAPAREIKPIVVDYDAAATQDDALDQDAGPLQINGVLVDKLDETRIVNLEEALVYPEPSTLRQSHIFRYERGEQVALIGKVSGAPWYVVETSSGYGFVRTNRFSRETIGGD